MLTARQIAVLKLLLELPEDDGREIVCDGRHCMVGMENISRRTVHALLAHMAIKDSGYAGAGCDIYIPAQNSAQIVARPALADEMVARVIARKPFFVDQHGFIQDA